MTHFESLLSWRRRRRLREARERDPSLKEAPRETWRFAPFFGLLQDLRFALRGMRKSASFSAVAVLTLALGIGANTAVFSVLRGILLRPLGYADPDRLVVILHRGDDPVAPANFIDFARQSRSFERMAAAGAWGATLSGRDHAEQIVGLQITSGMLALLGSQPLLGRAFTDEESQPGRNRVVLLGFDLWQRNFGGDRAILGRAIALNGAPYTVVGVMPAGFRFAPFWITGAELWTPLPLPDGASDRGSQFLRVFARLRRGVTLAQAQAEIAAICKRLQTDYPKSDAGLDARVIPLREKVVGRVRPALLALLGAVGFVLLIACANIANLALARTAERRREIAIRFALGAGRSRVARQLLTESLLLAAIGGAAGLLLAFWGMDALKAFIRQGGDRLRAPLPRIDEVALDPAVLLFTFLLSSFTGLLAGLIPAFQAARREAGDTLKEGGRAASESGGGARLRGALVVSEIAICLVLLAGAGLLLRTFLQLRAIRPGFDPRGVLTMTVSVAGQTQLAGSRRIDFYDRVARDVQALPGVVSVGMVNHLPLAGDVWGARLYAEGQPLPAPGAETRVVFRVCRPNYFRTMSIALRHGRDFTEFDDRESANVAIVNEKLAGRLWPNQNPLGKRVAINDPGSGDPAWKTVVGIIPDIRQGEWSKQPDHELYLPFSQSRDFLEDTHPWMAAMTLVVKTSGDPIALARPVQGAIWALNREVPLADVRSLEQVISASLWESRFHMLVVGLFAAFALALAVVGIYGVIGYSVMRRSHEIGIRMALGARRGAVEWMVVKNGLGLTAAGIAAGLLVALGVTRWLSSMLYGVTATDPLTFAAIPLLLALVALAASYLPARRAARIDPVQALRSE